MSRAKIQEILTCSITRDHLGSPVLAITGQTYEKHEIEQWFSSHNTDPATGLVLSSNQKTLIPNLFATNLINKLIDNRGFDTRDFICPLSQELLIDPVTTSEGHTYERSKLEVYFAEYGDIDPLSKKPIKLIGDKKFIANFCAKQCTETYKEELKEELKKEREAKQSIEQALAQKDFESLNKVNKKHFIKFFYEQSPAERITTVNLLISHLQPELLGYLYGDHSTVYIQDDNLFFSAFDLMWAMSKDIIYPVCDPLRKHEDEFGGYASLPKALKILSDSLKQQREKQAAFCRDLQANIENVNNYTHQEVIFYLNTKDGNGNTLLHLAVQNGNLPLIEWLLSKGADFNQKNQQDKTPCGCAIANNNLDVIQLFIRRGIIADQSANENSNNQTNRLILKVKTFLEEGNIAYEKAWSFKVLKFFNEYAPKLIEFLSTFIPEIDRPIKESQLLGELTQAYLQNKPFVKDKMVENLKKQAEIYREYYPPVFINLPPVENVDTKLQASASTDFRPTA